MTGVVESVTESAAEIAIAGINTAAAIYIADRQLDIAQEAQDIANKLNDHMCENYYPCEIKMLNEVCNTEEVDPEYEEQAGRFATTAKLQFAKIRQELDGQFSRFCCGNHMRLMKDLAIAEAQGVTDNVNFGYRVAEQRAQALNDLRCNKIFKALGMGRGLASAAVSYASVAGAQFSSLGSQAQASANSAFEALGYSLRGDQALQGRTVGGTYNAQPNGFGVGLGSYSTYGDVGGTTANPFDVGSSTNNVSNYNYYGVQSEFGTTSQLLGDSFGLGEIEI